MIVDDVRQRDPVSEMFWLTHEEAPLHEVTSQVVDDPGGDRIVHGPWTPQECQAVLSAWFDEGWLELIAFADVPAGWNLARASWRDGGTAAGEYVVLAQSASRLLADPTRWGLDSEDGMVMLCRTDEGTRHDFREWKRLAQRSDT